MSATAVTVRPCTQPVDRLLIPLVLLAVVDDRRDLKFAEEIVEFDQGVAGELGGPPDRDTVGGEQVDGQRNANPSGLIDALEPRPLELVEEFLGNLNGDIGHGGPPSFKIHNLGVPYGKDSCLLLSTDVERIHKPHR